MSPDLYGLGASVAPNPHDFLWFRRRVFLTHRQWPSAAVVFPKALGAAPASTLCFHGVVGRRQVTMTFSTRRNMPTEQSMESPREKGPHAALTL